MTVQTDRTPEAFQAAFIEFVAQAQTRINAYYAKSAPLNDVPLITYEVGKRYVRLVSTSPGSRCAFGFIDGRTGDVLKAAGWKAPATNFARGNIFDENNGLGRVSPYGVN